MRELGWGRQGNGGGCRWGAVGAERGAGCCESPVVLPEATAAPVGQREKGEVVGSAGAKPATGEGSLGMAKPAAGPHGAERADVAAPGPAQPSQLPRGS